jgi:hypothetical protein
VSRPTRYTRYARAGLRAGLAVSVLAGVCTGVAAARSAGPTSPAAADQAAGLSAALMASTRDAASPSTLAPSAAEQAAAKQAAAQQAAAAQAAAQKAAAQRAVVQRQAAAQQAARSALRDPRSAARLMLADHAWGAGQFQCLDALWSKESGWDHQAHNASSGAFGIPQALPGGKMASAGPDWQTNPVTQIRWGLRYIEDVYGSPCGAWAHSRANNWY